MRETIAVYFLLARVVRCCEGPQTVGDLRLRLWARNPRYQRETRPNEAWAAWQDADMPYAAPPDAVTVSIWIEKLNAVDPPTGTFSVELWTSISWNDPRLQFNSTLHGGCFPPDDDGGSPEYDHRVEAELWMPDLVFSTMALIGAQDNSPLTRRVKIKSNGDVEWLQLRQQTFFCFFAKLMPFDRYRCTIPLHGSRANSVAELTLLPGVAEIPIDARGGVPDWKVVLSEVHQSRTVFNESGIDFVVQLNRESGYYVETVMVPAALFVLVSYTSFFIARSAAPARVGMTVTSLLIISNFHNALFAQLPKISTNVYLVDFVRVSMFFCLAAIFEYALANYISRACPKLNMLHFLRNEFAFIHWAARTFPRLTSTMTYFSRNVRRSKGRSAKAETAAAETTTSAACEAACESPESTTSDGGCARVSCRAREVSAAPASAQSQHTIELAGVLEGTLDSAAVSEAAQAAKPRRSVDRLESVSAMGHEQSWVALPDVKKQRKSIRQSLSEMFEYSIPKRSFLSCFTNARGEVRTTASFLDMCMRFAFVPMYVITVIAIFPWGDPSRNWPRDRVPSENTQFATGNGFQQAVAASAPVAR